jgi:hypothetical protein
MINFVNTNKKLNLKANLECRIFCFEIDRLTGRALSCSVLRCAIAPKPGGFESHGSLLEIASEKGSVMEKSSYSFASLLSIGKISDNSSPSSE